MAIVRRKQQDEPYRIDLIHDAYVILHPFTAEWANRSSAKLLAMAQAEGWGNDYGKWLTESTIDLAKQAVASWEGIVDDDMQPLPVTDENIDRVLRGVPDCETAFRRGLRALTDRFRAEGEASGASHSTISPPSEAPAGVSAVAS
jgi:hypothetical protein